MDTAGTKTATSVACSNIAFIKYWGNRDDALRLPCNGSISMNLDGLFARTRVTFDPTACCDDIFTLNGKVENQTARARVSAFLDHVRRLAGLELFARVESENNFPTGAGIASSAAAFAALALAASSAAGLALDEAALSRLARLGSGSACRSIPGGFVEWFTGSNEADSYAVSIAPPEHWPLIDCVAVLQTAHKPVGSSEGHTLAATSPLQGARVADTPRRLAQCRAAIATRDFAALAETIEEDSNLMHAVMMTSRPALWYWEPETLALMQQVQGWRAGGLPAAYTIDAGANVHVICEAEAAASVQAKLQELPYVRQVYQAKPGGPARLV